MENHLFTPFTGDQSLADLPPSHRTPRMDRAPEGYTDGLNPEVGCGCGNGQDADDRRPIGNGGCGHNHDNGGCGHVHGHEGHIHGQNGCGQGIGNGGVGCGCVGFEGCGPDSWGLCEYPLAIAYAPCQVFRGLHDPATALARGTLFTELDLPLGHQTCGLITADCPCRGERRRT